MTREEAIKAIQDFIGWFKEDSLIRKALEMAIKALSQEPCDKCEVGNPCLYCKHEFEPPQKPLDMRCDECRNNHTSICGNCRGYDEFEEIEYVQEHKKIPVTLDLTPCDDAISREDVIKLVECSGYDLQFRTDNADMCDDVRKLPSVTQKSGKWIPVSERLPEDAYGCLVTVYDTDLRTQDEFENILPYFVGYDGETWNDADGEPIPFEVVAWMKLPAPYQKGGKE